MQLQASCFAASIGASWHVDTDGAGQGAPGQVCSAMGKRQSSLSG